MKREEGKKVREWTESMRERNDEEGVERIYRGWK